MRHSLKMGEEDMEMERLSKLLERQYSIGHVSRCELIRKGLNYAYLVTCDQGKYCFRIYRPEWRKPQDCLYELEAVDHLRQKGLPVAYPIATRDQRWLVELDEFDEPNGPQVGALFYFAEGAVPTVNEDSSRELGRLLAQLHIASDSWKTNQRRSFNIDLNHLVIDPMAQLKGILPDFLPESDVQYFEKTAAFLVKKLSTLPLSHGFCHGDLHDWNVHTDGESYVIFDFDCCSSGFRAYDLAVFWWTLLGNAPDVAPQCWSAFLEAYLAVNPLPEADIEAIPYFVTARRFWLSDILYKNPEVFGTGWLSTNGLNMFLNQLREDTARYGYELI